MNALDTVSLTILLGSLLVLAGIMSSLVAMRFGAPLLLAFLVVGMLAGESGPGGIRFDDVQLTYTVGSVALGLILFDGGLRTRFATFRSVLMPAGLLATAGVILTAALVAPAAVLVLGLGWTEALLVGAVVASTTLRRCSSCCMPKACACARASAPRWRWNRGPTIRLRSSSRSC